MMQRIRNNCKHYRKIILVEGSKLIYLILTRFNYEECLDLAGQQKYRILNKKLDWILNEVSFEY